MTGQHPPPPYSQPAADYARRAAALRLATAAGFHNPTSALRRISNLDQMCRPDGSADEPQIRARLDHIAAAWPMLMAGTPARAPRPAPDPGPDRGIAEAARRFGTPTPTEETR